MPRYWYGLALGLLFLVALGTRFIGLGGAVTEDEDQWIWRAGTFATGLDSHNWGRTYLTGHPGVTVMWLTTLTLGIERAMTYDHAIGGPDVTVMPEFLASLDRARVPFAVLQAGLVVLASAMVGRLLGPMMGLVSGLLMSADPFWAGVGPVVGMDGLLTGFLTVSLLAMLLGAGFGIAPVPALRGRIGWAALSGLAFGLAFLSKTTALLAGPVFPVVALVAAWYARRRQKAESLAAQEPGDVVGLADRWWAVPIVLLGVCGLVAALGVWLIWPAAWEAPIATLQRAYAFAATLGSEPHGPGNFLLGQPSPDPGPLFYPVALLVRLGPGTTIGLMLLFLFGAPVGARRVAWALVGYAALFLVLLTLAAKKVDRYELPILPSLAILAAIGWLELAAHLPEMVAAVRRRLTGADSLASPAWSGTVVLVALLALGLQVWPLVQAGRYPLAGYNPLVGGVRAAEKAIPVGWGDGLDVAGDMIRQMSGGRTVITAIWSPLRVSFGAHNPGPVVSQAQISEADFYVDYVHARQRKLTPRQLVNRTPDAIVRIGGVDYARIYKLK